MKREPPRSLRLIFCVEERKHIAFRFSIQFKVDVFGVVPPAISLNLEIVSVRFDNIYSILIHKVQRIWLVHFTTTVRLLVFGCGWSDVFILNECRVCIYVYIYILDKVHIIVVSNRTYF